MKKQQLPPAVNEAVNDLTRKYSESPATTNAGKVLRFLARFVTVGDLVKMLTHKNK